MCFAPALHYLGYHEARLVLSVPVPVHVAQLLAGRYESRRQWRPKQEYFTNIKDSDSDPYAFGPPGSGSVTTGCEIICTDTDPDPSMNSKLNLKTLISTVL
jgi:hypothetical protein